MTTPKDSTRTEDFKRATAGALRAMVQSADVQRTVGRMSIRLFRPNLRNHPP